MKKGKSCPIVEEPDDEIENKYFGLFSGNNFFGSISSEVKTFSTYTEYRNGKMVKKEEKGVHYYNNNGKEFMKIIKGGMDEEFGCEKRIKQ